MHLLNRFMGMTWIKYVIGMTWIKYVIQLLKYKGARGVFPSVKTLEQVHNLFTSPMHITGYRPILYL